MTVLVRLLTRLALAAFAAGPVLTSVALAAGEAKPAAAKGAASKQVPRPTASPELKKSGALVEQYCTAVRDAVSEARFASQKAELKALAKELDDRVAKLEARAAELKDWFSRREQFAKQATDQLVAIYAAMRTEAASEQLSRMDEAIAAAILSRLESRSASAILNDIPPDKAARLVTILAGASRKSDRGDKS